MAMLDSTGLRTIAVAGVIAMAVSSWADVPEPLRVSSLGYDAADSTEYLQRALDSGARRVIVDGNRDWVVRPLVVRRSNLEVVFENGCRLIAKKDEFKHPNDNLFSIRGGVTNVFVRGEGTATLEMQMKDYQTNPAYEWSEWRHALSIWDVSDVTVRNLTITRSGGDGVYVNGAKDVLVEDVRTPDCHRLGLCVISGENVTLRRCVSERTAGTPPKCGIDIEPNKVSNVLKNILVEDCRFENNEASGVLLHLNQLTDKTEPVSIVFRNCVSRGNRDAGYMMSFTGEKGMVKGTVTFENCISDGNKFDVTHHNQCEGGVKVIEKNCNFKTRRTTPFVRPVDAAPLVFDSLTPRVCNAPAGEVSTGQIRIGGTFVQWAPEAGLYRVEFRMRPLGRGVPKASVTVKDKLGTDLGSFEVGPARRVYEFETKHPNNLYRFEITIEQGTLEVTTRHPGAGLRADNLQRIYTDSGRTYAFDVPAGTKEVRVEVSPEEAVSARLIAPDGRIAAEMPEGLTRTILKAVRSDATKAETWRVEFPSVKEDASFRIGAPCVPVAWLLPRPATRQARRMDRTKFQVGALCLKPGARDEAHVRDIAACGIDFMYGIPADDGELLDLFAKYGVGVIASGAVPYWHGMDGQQAGEMRTRRPAAAYAEALNRFRDHPAIWMIDLVDEPSALDYETIGEVVRQLDKAHPHLPPYVNLYPMYARAAGTSASQQTSQLGTATYDEYIARYVTHVPTDYISFDFYLYAAKPEARQQMLGRFHENFATIAAACRASGRSFWPMVQVNSRFEGQPLSVNQLRFQAFSAMAFGAEALQWACWSSAGTAETPDMPGLTGWWHHNVLDAHGEKTPQYERLKTVNGEIHRLGEPFMRYRNVATRRTGNKAVWSAEGVVLTVGEMVARQGRGKAFFVVMADDPWDRAPATHRLLVADGAARVTGTDGPIALTRAADGSWGFELKSNAAALVEVADTTPEYPPFKIGVYRLSRADRTRPNVIDLRTANVDIVHDNFLNDTDTLDLFAEYGIQAVCGDLVCGFWGGHTNVNGNIEKLCPPDKYATYMDHRLKFSHPTIAYASMGDENSALDFAYLGRMAREVAAKKRPELPLSINLHPSTQVRPQLYFGVSNYVAYVDAYLRHMPLGMISYDLYPYAKGRDWGFARFYENLRIVGDACRDHGKRFWYIGQVNSTKVTQEITIPKLRYQAFGAMAFGIDEMHWACWSHGWWTNNVLSATGEKTIQFERLCAVNRELRRLAPAYMRYHRVETHLTGFTGVAAKWLQPDEKVNVPQVNFNETEVRAGAFENVRADDGLALVVGEMTPRQSDDRTHAMFVFAAEDPYDEHPAKRTVRFASALPEVRALGPRGPVEVLPGAAKGEWRFELNSSDGVLVVGK